MIEGNVVSQQLQFKFSPPSSKACGPQKSQTSGRLSNKQQREDYVHRKIRLRSCGKLAVLPAENDAVLKNSISRKPAFVLRKQVVCVVVPYGWVIASWCFEGTYRLHLQGYDSVNLLITLNPERWRLYVSWKHEEVITQQYGTIVTSTIMHLAHTVHLCVCVCVCARARAPYNPHSKHK